MVFTGELWRHRATGRIVRIERSRQGFLSVSWWVALWEDGRWGGEFQIVGTTIWDELEFKHKFEPIGLKGPW